MSSLNENTPTNITGANGTENGNVKKKTFRRRFIVPVLALAAVASLAGFETLKPTMAKAASPAPAAAALDDNSVGPLLALDRAMETVAARVTPAIVNVAVTSKSKQDVADQGELPDGIQQFFGPFFGQHMQIQPQQRIEHGIGTGVIISPDGYIVTNNHVVDGSMDIRVTMGDRRILPAKLIGTDPLTDLAVIKINANDLPSVPWGDSTELRPGETVLAFGNPFGFRFTVTRGIVSALNRPNPYSDDARKPGEFIQTDAAINPGNSGGPLVDARGEVVGINTFLVSPSGSFSGMGFAIPTQIVRPTVETLIKYGKVTHGYIGIGISDITPDNSKFFEVKDNRGAVVTQVEPDSPGAKAGLKVGDVISEIDGRRVSDAGELQVEVGQKRPGTTLKLVVLRDGKDVTIPVTLEEMGKRDVAENGSVGQHGKARWGLGLADVTPESRQEVQAPSNVQGAVIERVVPGSPADNAGLQPGDVVEGVNRHEVKSAADVQRALSAVPTGQDALLLVWSRGGNSFRVLHSPDAS
ncbi:MAG TPA: Do family serine endopeptidase [Terriglobales bacterium]|jgi:serine protease Do|nr:Do family serine endopeptidase [Terriglobales bacterium]